MMDRRIKLRSVNKHITCALCKGYFIDATTITECLHTFCKSCLVKYLDGKNVCPTCGILIHQSHPLNYISHDRTMQDIVYKLVPHLQDNELQRQLTFYNSRGLPIPKEISGENDDTLTCHNNNMSGGKNNGATTCRDDEDDDCHRGDEQLNICLQCRGNQLKKVKRRFLRCSAQATVTHIKKFIALKLFNNLTKFKDVDILCNDEILGKDHTLKFVAITRWRNKDVPLLLHYRQRLQL